MGWVKPTHIIYKEMLMFINKIGTQHHEIGMNCQDYGLEKDGLKLVCDGCSEGDHSEIGAKSYCHLAGLGYGVHQIFKRLVDMFGQSTLSVKNFLCFTILSVTENGDYFKVSYNNGNQFSCGFVYNAYDKLMEDKTKFDSSI